MTINELAIEDIVVFDDIFDSQNMSHSTLVACVYYGAFVTCHAVPLSTHTMRKRETDRCIYSFKIEHM